MKLINDESFTAIIKREVKNRQFPFQYFLISILMMVPFY